MATTESSPAAMVCYRKTCQVNLEKTLRCTVSTVSCVNSDEVEYAVCSGVVYSSVQSDSDISVITNADYVGRRG